MIFRHDLLQGSKAVVTGGGTGIGATISEELARHGADVAILSRDSTHHVDVVRKIEDLGGKGCSVSADVRDPEAVQAAVQQVVSELGDLDIVVNCAAGNFLSPAEELSYNAWRAVVDIVLQGTFLVSKTVFPILKRQKRSSIINIGTTYADASAPYVAHSGAAKAGTLNLTRTLAYEWARYGIRVNMVSPGPIDETEGARRLFSEPKLRREMLQRIAAGRMGRKEEVAWAVLFLVSEAADYITGQNLRVDGGTSLATSGFELASELLAERKNDGQDS